MLQIVIPIARSHPQAEGAWVAISVRGINANIGNYAFPIPGIWAQLVHATGSAKTNHNGAGGDVPWLSGAHVGIICPGGHVHQPTPSSIAAAEDALVDIWLSIEVAALARAREADGINDRIACEGALADVQRVTGR
jgi:hypothetical protein